MQQALEVTTARRRRRSSVRIGIAHGEATPTRGDYFGEPVVEAARLCARADGGQILATDIVRLLARAQRARVRAGRSRSTLKGLPEPVDAVRGALAAAPRRPAAAAPEPAGRPPGRRRWSGATTSRSASSCT